MIFPDSPRQYVVAVGVGGPSASLHIPMKRCGVGL